MLADHVHAQLLEQLKVKSQSFESRRQIDTIWPESLIEGAHLEYKLPI